jgi:hypothetical protein
LNGADIEEPPACANEIENAKEDANPIYSVGTKRVLNIFNRITSTQMQEDIRRNLTGWRNNGERSSLQAVKKFLAPA